MKHEQILNNWVRKPQPCFSTPLVSKSHVPTSAPAPCERIGVAESGLALYRRRDLDRLRRWICRDPRSRYCNGPDGTWPLHNDPPPACPLTFGRLLHNAGWHAQGRPCRPCVRDGRAGASAGEAVGEAVGGEGGPGVRVIARDLWDWAAAQRARFRIAMERLQSGGPQSAHAPSWSVIAGGIR